MKRLYVIAPADSRRTVLRALTRLGCVELERCSAQQIVDSGGKLYISEENTQAAKARSILENACRLLKNSGAAKKTPLFAVRPEVTERQLFDMAILSGARQTAEEVDTLGAKLADAGATQSKLGVQIAALGPWRPLDVPLNFTGTRVTTFIMGTLPAAIETDPLFARLHTETPACMVEVVCSDNEQHYLAVTIHREQEVTALNILKSAGFVSAGFKDSALTAGEQIEALQKQITTLEDAKTGYIQQIAAYYDRLPALELAFDAYTQEAARDELLSATAQTERTAYFTGWLPTAAESAVAKLLIELGCAYTIDDPPENETPPVLIQNSALVSPVQSVTEMYDTPGYDSVVDPNPFMFPFYITFFGLIMADMAYGLLMFFGCFFALKAMKPKGTMEKTLRLFMYCGVTTFFAGMLFGGFFANSIAVFTNTFLGKTIVIPPLWFDPSADPMKMLAFSATLGGVHILLGMALAAYRMIRQGHVLDAMFDVGSWYIIFAGIGIYVLKNPVGQYVIIAGALLLVVTGGRNSPSILGKITGGLGSLYGITGYLSDVLSYARIMALGLSGAMVGQVMNQLGTMAGGGFFGLLVFIVVFLAGHTFNLAISLLGAYVHTGRLQYIEFFGKFFEGGGRAFRPLVNNTNYVTIIKED
ncbi:MAG TPA: V-type ATP synthase subunit I [Clostridia bacterium]|nr:V-type ATP synthase subunit I [Clostridia bacterium]